MFGLPFFDALFAVFGGGVCGVAAIPEGMVGDGCDVADLVEELVAFFAAVGFEEMGVGLVFVATNDADHDEVEQKDKRDVEDGLAPKHGELAGCLGIK